MDNEVMFIKLDDIIPNRFQPREIFDEEALNNLAESIKQHGVIEPILVRPVSNKFEIVAGERRYKASVLAGLTKIPALVRQLDDKESSIIAFIENEHRTDVSAIEEARTMDRILKTNKMTQEELGKELGINQSTIANKLRLLNLPIEVQEALMRNEISERHARSLLTVKNEEKQLELLNKIKEKRMTVRELDSEIKEMNNMNENMNMYNNNQNNMDNSSVYTDYLNPTPAAPSTPSPAPEPGFMDYLNNYDNKNPLPAAPATPVQQPEPGFLDFLNNYDNNNPLPAAPATPVQQPDPGFMDYLNNYDNKNPLPETPAAPVQQPEPGFMDYLNNYDNKNPLPETPATPVQPQDPGFMDYLNNYDNNNPLPTTPTQAAPVQPEPGFLDFLNNYDNNNPLPETPVAPSTPSSAPEPGFMDYLNNYDNNNPLPETPVQPQEPGFMDFLNNYDNKNPLPETPTQPESGVTEDLYMNYSEPKNNVVINDVKPPIATGFENQYIENNPNFVDVSKQTVIDNVDEIINRLKAVVDDIKSTSKFKIDTDEINYDDIYQITIKIDKRDF